MTKRTRVAREQAREFYEKVVKPHHTERSSPMATSEQREQELRNEREKSSFFYVAYSSLAEQLNTRKGKS